MLGLPSPGARRPLFGCTREALADIAAAFDLPPYAAGQMAAWLYARGCDRIEAMTDLPKSARARMADAFAVGRTPPLREAVSADGTRKYLFAAGGRAVETALIPDRGRATLCLSTQVGCRRRCRFCATGQRGLHGNLTAGEILNAFASLPLRSSVTNLVYMGMGEPLDNLDAVIESLRILTEPWGYGWSPTRITVSTVGVLPALERLVRETRCHIALSLHSPFPEERRALMPVEADCPLDEVLACLRRARIGGQRRLMVEIVAFRGLNTTPAHARELARKLQGLRCRVNLIPFNRVPDLDLEGADRAEMEAFQRALMARGLRTTIRASRGADIAAACGLLAGIEPA